MEEEKQARFVEWSCNVFIDVFWYFGVPRLWSLYYGRLSWDKAARRIVTCREKVLDSMWHWIQQDRRVDLNNIHFLQRRPDLRRRAQRQRYVCPRPLPPGIILLNEISHLEPPDYIILEFFRDFNRLLTGRDQYGNLKYSAFLTVTLCCVEQKFGNKVLNLKTWGGSAPLPKHLRDVYIKYAARWFWHPIVSLPVLISLDQTEKGKALDKVRVRPSNPPILSCRAFHFRPDVDGDLPGVRMVPPCSHCMDMFPSHDQTAGESAELDGRGYVRYTFTPPDDASPNWCRGNCAEVAAFGEMFKLLKQKCRVVNGDAETILAKYKMDRMTQAKLVQ